MPASAGGLVWAAVNNLSWRGADHASQTSLYNTVKVREREECHHPTSQHNVKYIFLSLWPVLPINHIASRGEKDCCSLLLLLTFVSPLC